MGRYGITNNQCYCTFCGAHCNEDDRRYRVLSWDMRSSMSTTLFYYGHAPKMDNHSMLCKECYKYMCENRAILELLDRVDGLIRDLRGCIRYYGAKSTSAH